MYTPDSSPLLTPHDPPLVQKDSILGLLQTLKEDPRTEKIDLLAGVLKKEGRITFFESVRLAQKAFLDSQSHKNYLPITGDVEAVEAIASLMWLRDSFPAIKLQTLGATGALSLSANLSLAMGYQSVILASPSWPNHSRIFHQAGLSISTYEHLEKTAFSNLKTAIEEALSPSVVLIQPLCHNPTGLDFTFEELEELFALGAKARHLMLFDVPYLGLKWSVDEDAQYIEKMTRACSHWLMSYSCSKNMTLYGERVGMLFGSLQQEINSQRAQEYLGHLTRSSYSNPVLHGSGIAKTLLVSPELKTLWKKEVNEAREDLSKQRKLLMNYFQEAGFRKWSLGLASQSGMFGYFSLSKEKALRLRQAHAIYLPLEGRVNLTSLNPLICQRLVECLLHEGEGV